MKEALYWSEEAKGIRCQLCPHHCLILKNQCGLCGQRKNIEGRLMTLNYGVITSKAIDPIEKKPLYHFMPGSKIMSYGSRGCNLSCLFCQNHRIALDKNPPFIRMTPEEIIEEVYQLGLKSVAFTYNEPVVWIEYMMDIADLAKKRNIATVCVTNGFIDLKPLGDLIPYIDAFNVDLKSFSDAFYKNVCRGAKAPVLESIKLISIMSYLEITALIVEQENDQMDELEEMFKWIASIDDNIALHLSRYFPAYKMDHPPTKVETLIQAKKIAQKHLKRVYIGNVPGIQ